LQKVQGLPVTASKLAVQGIGVESPTPTVLSPSAYNQNTVRVFGEVSPTGSDNKARDKSPEKDKESTFTKSYFKFYVGPGNNFSLVRSVFKYRWWF
jgi:hypothetical protein